jgi:GntR family transcriptional regulator
LPIDFQKLICYTKTCYNILTSQDTAYPFSLIATCSRQPSRKLQNMDIDKAIPIPLYYQLQEILREQIEGGVWQPGEFLPSEWELCKTYNLSRITVRNALHRLDLEGYITRVRGKGSHVSQPKVRELILQSLTGSYADRYPQDNRLATRLLEIGLEVPPTHVQQVFNLLKKQQAIKIVRIRYVDGDPLYWTKAYVPYEVCPELLNEDFVHHSFFEIMEKKYGLIFTRSERSIYTVLATNKEINYLNLKNGAPISVVESISYLDNGKAAEYSKTYFRADRCTFEVVITRQA